ncbi:Histone acetyltransferase [Balamuthia mandrillaris]
MSSSPTQLQAAVATVLEAEAEAEVEGQGEMLAPPSPPKEKHSNSHIPPASKWKKRWVTTGHMKVFKWAKYRANNAANSNAVQRLSARTFNDNAPITRSVTAAFKEKTKREMEQRAKKSRRGRRASPAPRRSSRRLSRKDTQIVSTISQSNIITPESLYSSDEPSSLFRASGHNPNTIGPTEQNTDSTSAFTTTNMTAATNELHSMQTTATATMAVSRPMDGLITNGLPESLPLPFLHSEEPHQYQQSQPFHTSSNQQ